MQAVGYYRAEFTVGKRLALSFEAERAIMQVMTASV